MNYTEEDFEKELPEVRAEAVELLKWARMNMGYLSVKVKPRSLETILTNVINLADGATRYSKKIAELTAALEYVISSDDFDLARQHARQTIEKGDRS